MILKKKDCRTERNVIFSATVTATIHAMNLQKHILWLVFTKFSLILAIKFGKITKIIGIIDQ